eukprot:TRINITY_DN9398_c0_g1_i4.p1 TRINITY_DN9398_c0_g1~~TRINITY_DN9398_c0_g1_i4.p1  ORF type:complete len:244 (-),score=47.42 TRINITY_DN9398_c0_g1_i4:475-1206(-)
MSGYLQDGLALVNQAVQLDSCGNAADAVGLYQRSLVCFEQALIGEPNPQTRALIASKMAEYKNRKEELEASLARVDLSERMSRVGVATLPSQVARAPPAAQLPLPPAASRPNVGPASSQRPPSIGPASSFTSSYGGFPYAAEAPVQPPPEASQGFALPLIPAPEELSKADALRAATELIQRAQAEDGARQYQNALAAYKRGCDYYLRVMTEEPNADAKSRVSVSFDSIECASSFFAPPNSRSA